MNLKGWTIRSSQSQIDALITEQWVTFHLDHPDNKVFVNPTAGMRGFAASVREGSCTHPQFFHIYTAADAKIPAKVAAPGTSQMKIGLGNWGYWEDAKSSKYQLPWQKRKTLTGAPLWRTGDKGAPPSPQPLSVRKPLQKKGEAPTSAPTTQTLFSTGEVINVSKQDNHGAKCSLIAFCIGDIEETPPARFRALHYQSWVVNADLFVEYDTAGFIPKWLSDVMMLHKNLIFCGETDVVYCICQDMQRLWRIKKEKDPSAVPFYHVRLPVYSWMSGSVTANMYQFEEHNMWIGTTSCWDKQVNVPRSLSLTTLSARGLAHCCLSVSSFLIASPVAEPSDVLRWTFRRDAEQDPRCFHASDSRYVVP